MANKSDTVEDEEIVNDDCEAFQIGQLQMARNLM